MGDNDMKAYNARRLKAIGKAVKVNSSTTLTRSTHHLHYDRSKGQNGLLNGVIRSAYLDVGNTLGAATRRIKRKTHRRARTPKPTTASGGARSGGFRSDTRRTGASNEKRPGTMTTFAESGLRPCGNRPTSNFYVPTNGGGAA